MGFGRPGIASASDALASGLHAQGPFRVEGLFRLGLDSENAPRSHSSGRLDEVMAGARSHRLHALEHTFIVKMHFFS